MAYLSVYFNRMMRYLICLLLASYGMSVIAQAQAPVVVLTDSTGDTDLWRSPGTSYFEDKGQHMTLAQVRQQRFRAVAGHGGNFGFTNSSLWVRLRLRNESKQPTARIIGSTTSLIDTLDYYLINEATGQTTHQQHGRLIPHGGQRIDTHDRVFPLELRPNQTFTVYFRVGGRNSKMMNFIVKETHRYYAHYQQSTWRWACYIGFCLTMIVVQIIFFALTRNRNSLYYLLYLLAFMLVETSRGNGMVADRYLWPDATWFKSNILLLAVPLSTVLGMRFYASGLRLKHYSPLLYRALQVDAALAVLLAGWALLHAQTTNVVQHVLLTAFFSDLLVLVACAYVWWRGYRPARFFLLATLCFFGGIALTVGWHMGLLPSGSWFGQSLNIGCILEMLFFTTALADEYRLTQQEKQQVQHELIGVLKNRNAELSTAQLKGQTIERQRVAADLHDNLGSTLTALKWMLDATNKASLTPEERAVYAAIREQVGQAYTDVRLLSHNLLPDELAKQGLATALNQLVEKLNRNTSMRFQLTGTDALPRLDHQTEFELYSICLELVNNTLKHAGATEGAIGFGLSAGTLQMQVSDNGRGLPQPPTGGRGLQNVAARVAALSGTWVPLPGPVGGILNQITVPVRELTVSSQG